MVLHCKIPLCRDGQMTEDSKEKKKLRMHLFVDKIEGMNYHHHLV